MVFRIVAAIDFLEQFARPHMTVFENGSGVIDAFLSSLAVINGLVIASFRAITKSGTNSSRSRLEVKRPG